MPTRWTTQSLRLNLLLVVLLLSLPSVVSANSPSVVASIAPVHGLVARVMVGVGVPELLIARNASAHSYTLKPSDAKMLSTADAVFWIGKPLEVALDKSIQTLATAAQVSSLMNDRDRGVELLTRRKAGLLDTEETSGNTQDVDSADPHVWLNPQNAAAMMLHIAEVLAGVDPENSMTYLSNAHDAAIEMDVLSRYIDDRLAPHRSGTVKIIFFHDAFQYFEERFAIKPDAIIKVDPDHAPGARRIAEIRSLILKANKVCLYSEPHYSLKLVTALIDDTTAIHGQLDPVGMDIPLGPEFYDALMRNFVNNFVGCLER